MIHRLVASAAVLALSAVCAPATAQEAKPLEPTPKGIEPFRPKREWYGWQTLIVDGGSLGILIVGSSTNSSAAAGAFFFTNILGPPIVHWAHGNVGTGFASFGIRGGAWLCMIAGILATADFGGGSSKSDSGAGVALVAVGVIGVLAAPAIDAAVFAFDDVTPESASRKTTPRFTAGPFVARGGGGLSFSGAF